MKRVVPVMLLLLCCITFVYAESDELTVTASVGATNKAYFSIDGLSPTETATFDKAITEEGAEAVFYVVSETNSTSGFDISIYGTALTRTDCIGDEFSGTEGKDSISLVVTVDETNSAIFDTPATNGLKSDPMTGNDTTKITLAGFGPSDGGVKKTSKQLSATVDSADAKALTAGFYEAYLKLDYSAT